MELSVQQKRDLADRFDSAIKHIGKAEIKYVLEKFDEKFSGIDTTDYPSYIQQALRLAGFFGELLHAYERDQEELNWESIAAMTAALIYFLNPWDLIPDAIPQQGYLDDAYVINLCFHYLQRHVDLSRYEQRYPALKERRLQKTTDDAAHAESMVQETATPVAPVNESQERDEHQSAEKGEIQNKANGVPELTRISIYVPQKFQEQRPLERLNELAEAKDRSLNHMVVQAILEYVEREELLDKPLTRALNAQVD